MFKLQLQWNKEGDWLDTVWKLPYDQALNMLKRLSYLHKEHSYDDPHLSMKTSALLLDGPDIECLLELVGDKYHTDKTVQPNHCSLALYDLKHHTPRPSN